MTDQELIGYLDRRFGEISQKMDEKIDGLREENRQTRTSLEEENRQTRAAMEEGDRQTRVLVEGIRSDVRLVAEGVIGQGEVFAMRQVETLQKIEEVKAMILPLYRSLDGRVKILEERMEREASEVMEVIREKFGKH